MSQRFVKIGELTVDSGEIVLIAPENLEGRKFDFKEDTLNDLVQNVSLSTGGDGVFSVYAVFEEGQKDNLPLEYRIPIKGNPYK